MAYQSPFYTSFDNGNRQEWTGSYRDVYDRGNQNTWGNPNNRRCAVPREINGRTIQDIDDTIPQEVPMDGSVVYYPTRDHSAIYAKGWAKDGSRIVTQKYVPEESGPTVEQILMGMHERLCQIEESLKEKGDKAVANLSKNQQNNNQNNQKKQSNNQNQEG